MKNGDFSSALIRYTADNSNFETSRDYISMSQVHLPVDKLIAQYEEGFQDSMDIRLKCYKGYQMEKDLMRRIIDVWGDYRVRTGIELSAFDGLVKGHPDFSFDEHPADCKSVLMDEWLPKDGRLPKRIYWQMQAYMYYGVKDKALVVFESRESGKMEDYWITSNRVIQKEIAEKLHQVVKAVKRVSNYL